MHVRRRGPLQVRIHAAHLQALLAFGIKRLNLCSFDSASLAILDKLNTIEELLRGTNDRSETVAAAPSTADSESRGTLSRLKSLNSPSLERTKDQAPCHMNIEGVLSWSVFDDISPNLDLKSLLNSSRYGQQQNLSISTELDEHIAEEDLVSRFMNNVFIYNPVLEEAKIHRYMRDARFNGIGWDAQSCLLVTNPFGLGFIPNSDAISS